MRTRTLRSSSKSIPTESTSSSKSENTRKRLKTSEKLKGCAKTNITDNSSSKKQDVTSDSENESVDELTNNGQDPYPHCSNCNRTFKTYAGAKRHEGCCKRKSNKNNSFVNEENCKTSETSDELDLNSDTAELNSSCDSSAGINLNSDLDSENNVTPDSLSVNRQSKGANDILVKEESNNGENKETPPKQCVLCNKNFKSPLGLRRHENICKGKASVNNEKPLSTEDRCKLGIEEENDLLAENGDVASEKKDEKFDEDKVNKNLCKCCGEDKATAHKEGDFECKTCPKRFRLKTSLERHIRFMHTTDNHECPQCGAKCPDKGTLARHMYTHTGLKPYSCPVCNQEFSRKYHVVRHNMQTGCDGKEKPVFPCQVCGREFNRKDNLREHLRAHAGQAKRKKKIKCDCCDVEFTGMTELRAHKKAQHAKMVGSMEKQYACEFCPKHFPSSGAMKKHRRTHTGERPYECGTCGKSFSAKETLNRHVRIHTGYKPHSCQYCGKSFIQSSQLKAHLHNHTGQSVLQPTETYVCDLCGKSFNRRTRLNEHIKYIHLGAKPFECMQCGKTFIRKEDINRHLIIHSGVKAHQCPICSKCFAMKSTLKVHLLTHTKEPPRSCDVCGRAFIRQDCLLRHMRNKHREMLEEIKSEAEKKKLQQQLLQVAAEASLVEGMEAREELDENGLVDAVRELLTLLVDETTLKGLGWPDAGVEALLEAVIKRCGHEPAPSSTPRHDRLRHNIKLLFTVVIDDSAVKALLNNQTVDEVILHVLRLAKS